MKTKLLFKGHFNWYGEIYILYRYANSESHAMVLMCYELAQRLKIKWVIVHHFFTKTNKYKIESA